MSNPMPLQVKRQRSLLFGLLPMAILLSAAFVIGSAFLVIDYKQSFSRLRIIDALKEDIESKICKNQCRSDGSESLPKGIVTRTSNLEMRPLWGHPKKKNNSKLPMSLLAMAVGKKQKTNVNEIVKKFPSNDFVVMLFHYDGVVDDWKDFEWSSRAIHVSAINQTKWWFAKRFLHPDVVAVYAYIFLWDEDLGVANFHAGRVIMENWQYKKTDVIPKGSESIKYDLNTMLEAEHGKNMEGVSAESIQRTSYQSFSTKYFQLLRDGMLSSSLRKYVSVIKDEGLHISQPALDPDKSEVHHRITSREKGQKVHRRIYKKSISGKICYANSTDPPCTGWVEMMAPVFSRESWRCVWHMIQNDLIHAWGLDMQLGYCAQGNRTQNIGVVDSEYVVHQGLPTLGGSAENKTNTESPSQASRKETIQEKGPLVPSFLPIQPNARDEVRRQSLVELEIFKNRWKKAVREDECWFDLNQQQPVKRNN